MTWSSPVRAQQSYRHEAFLWHDAEDYTNGLVPFLEEGLESGEPMMVAVLPEHASWLRDALGARAETITFIDMAEIGRNPARIIPAWQQFLDERSGPHRPVRGIGEPIWPSRRPVEIEECQLHEALLNVAIDPELPFWLICPYDADGLGADVVEEAHRSHPVIVEAGSYQGSGQYGGRAHVDTLFAAPLADPADRSGEPRTAQFSEADVARLGRYLRLEFYVAGLPVEKAADLSEVVQRLAESSVRRGSATGTLRMWNQPDALVCEIADDTVVDDLLLGRRVPFEKDHDALWVANQLCDLVQLRSTENGTAVRVHAWK
jgi:hypothetical protein